MLTTTQRAESDVDTPDAGQASVFIDAGILKVKLPNGTAVVVGPVEPEEDQDGSADPNDMSFVQHGSIGEIVTQSDGAFTLSEAGRLSTGTYNVHLDGLPSDNPDAVCVEVTCGMATAAPRIPSVHLSYYGDGFQFSLVITTYDAAGVVADVDRLYVRIRATG